jgi:hypothetical protein
VSDIDTTVGGGFAGDPDDALTATGADGCCGNPSSLTLTAPSSSAPCCGTQTEATAESSCCGSAAKSTAVAAGQGCCG